MIRLFESFPAFLLGLPLPVLVAGFVVGVALFVLGAYLGREW
jgi:hypothetical protein